MCRGVQCTPPKVASFDELVDLLLLEKDKYIVLGEVHRLEMVSLVVQVQGSRPNRSKLRHILYVAFSEEMANILDIQFMSRGCYHVEFADEDSVSKLLAIKEAGVEGAWISFHKWSHNVKVDEILQDQESSMIFTAIFPGLRKEWRNVLPRIGALLGKVIATCDGQASGSDRVGGVPVVRVIAPRSVRLPTMISLPNLLTNKPPIMQNVYYQGLPNQCFVCHQFGHLGRECQKRRPNVESHPPPRSAANNDGWSSVSTKHVFKPTNTLVNPLLLLEANPYHSLQEVEKDVNSKKVDVTKEQRVEQNSQDILLQVQASEHVIKVNKQSNKGKQIVFDQVQQIDMSLVVNDVKQNEGIKVDLVNVDMDSENIGDFTSVARSSDRVDKHMPVRSHKVIGKDLWANKRQLRASEDGRKGRDVALAERRIGGKTMIDG